MRTRSTKNEMLHKRMELYSNMFNQLESKGKIVYTKGMFDEAMDLWSVAARECGLSFRQGWLYMRNNKYKFPFIYLPQRVSKFPNDLGDDFYFAQDGFWVQAKPMNEKKTKEFLEKAEDPEVYRGKQLYQIRKVCPQKEIAASRESYAKLLKRMWGNGYLIKDKDKCISLDKFMALINSYSKVLNKRILMSDFDVSYSGWHLDWSSKQKMSYLFASDTILNECSHEPLAILESDRVKSPMSSALFSATLFSITKVLLHTAKLPTDFVLYMTLENINREYDILYDKICFYCNPKKYNDFEEIYTDNWDGPYAFVQQLPEVLSPLCHHNFPILYILLDPDVYGLEDTTFLFYYHQREAEKMKKASALPILLSPIEDSKGKAYGSCLAMLIPITENDRRYDLMIEDMRNKLFAFYAGFLSFLNKNPKMIISQAKKYYKQALAELHCDQNDATKKQTQVACLLTAVYLAEEYVISEVADQRDPFAYTKELFVSFARTPESKRKRIASKAEFADFLQELIDKQEDSFPLLLQDAEYLYLDFKEYWDAFECYCQKNGIYIQDSHKGFRRKYLASDFLKAQYAQKDGEYARYDYRKIIGGEKKTVLAVKKTILEYARSSAKSGI